MQKDSCSLAQKSCTPCKGGTEPLKGSELKGLASEINGEWNVINEHHLEKTYKFSNFKKGLEFINAIGEIAENEGHHPDIFLTWGQVKITLWTHKIDGLTESDFILAAKCDSVSEGQA